MFVIRHKGTGEYLIDDEDRGWSYQKEIDDFTVKFDNRKDAQWVCESYEEVIEIN
jgi:hypothetical protein